MNKIEQELRNALQVLRIGGVILYPTDTIWGIGCDATNSNAVDIVFKIKQREESKSLIILIDQQEKLNKYLNEVPAMAWNLMEVNDKPLTIIYPGAKGLEPRVINEDGSVAIRLTKDDFCSKLIQKLGKPIVSTSANISGELAPGKFQEISEQILNQVDYIVKLRQQESTISQPSAIIKLALNGEFKIIRK